MRAEPVEALQGCTFPCHSGRSKTADPRTSPPVKLPPQPYPVKVMALAAGTVRGDHETGDAGNARQQV